jgi:hypothetical protein
MLTLCTTTKLDAGNAVMYCPPRTHRGERAFVGSGPDIPSIHRSFPRPPPHPISPSSSPTFGLELVAVRKPRRWVHAVIEEVLVTHSDFPHMPWEIAISPSRAMSRAERYVAYSKCVALSM